MQVTSTGIAVALAVVIALAFLFFGASAFAPFAGVNQTATTTEQQASSTQLNARPVSMDTNESGARTITTASGLQITDEVVGTGAEVKAGDTISANYTGMLEDGTVFDASARHGGPASFPIGVGRVIQGWDEGIVGMKVGGTRRLVIPGDLAYGPQGMPQAGIPGNATLIFEVEVVGVN